MYSAEDIRQSGAPPGLFVCTQGLRGRAETRISAGVNLDKWQVKRFGMRK